jgi:hypothetical protein
MSEESIQTRIALLEQDMREIKLLKDKVNTLERLVWTGFGIVIALQVLIPFIKK